LGRLAVLKQMAETDERDVTPGVNPPSSREITRASNVGEPLVGNLGIGEVIAALFIRKCSPQSPGQKAGLLPDFAPPNSSGRRLPGYFSISGRTQTPSHPSPPGVIQQRHSNPAITTGPNNPTSDWMCKVRSRSAPSPSAQSAGGVVVEGGGEGGPLLRKRPHSSGIGSLAMST
jgi:hypothetical protein